MKEYRQLKHLARLINGYTFKSSEYTQEGIRVIRIANVQDGYIADNAPCYYDIAYKEQIGEAYLEENDLLMSLTGNVGRVGLITKEFLPAGLNQRVACIRTDNELTKRYLYYYFRSPLFVTKAIESSNGCAQLNMSTEWLKNHQVPTYETIKLKQIVSKLDIINQAIETEKHIFSSYDELIKARFILQEEQLCC